MAASPSPSSPPSVAGPEVVGRTLAVWDSKRMDWPKAVVIGYNASTGKHQVRHRGRDGHEAWLDLGKSRFQWVGKPVPGSAPNPTAARAPSDPQALLGVRVKVFWPGMAKWYLGKVVGYDSGSSCHTVKYRDGDEQQLQLCHEAVMYLDAGKRPAGDEGTSPPPAKKARRSSSPKSTSKTRRTSPGSADKSRRSTRQWSPAERKARRKTPGRGRPRAVSRNNSTYLRTRDDSMSSSASSSSESDSSSSPSSSGDDGASSSLGASASTTQVGPRPRDSFDSATSSDAQAARTSATGTRSTTDDPLGSGSTPEAESDNVGARAIRRAGRRPKKVVGSAPAAARAPGMAKRGSQSKPRRGGSNNVTASSPLAQGPAGVAAVGARVVLLGREDPVPPGALSPDATPLPPVYRGQLVQYDSYHKRYKLAYDEGGEEWVSLLRERFWVLGPRTESSEQRWAALAAQGAVNVGLNTSSISGASAEVHPWIKTCSCGPDTQQDASVSSPDKQPGVEDPLAVRCLADGRYYFGTVVAVDSGENNKTSALVLYADGEDEWVDLGESKGSGAGWRPVTPSEKESVLWRHVCPAPSAEAAVGWKVALFREPERRFVPGKVVSVKQEGVLEIALADSIEQVPLKTARPDSVVGAYSSRVKWISPPGLVLRRATPRAGEAEAAGSGGAFSPRAGAAPAAAPGPASGAVTPRTASGGVQAKRLPSISRLAVAGSAQPPPDHQGGGGTPLLGSPRAFTPMSGEPSGEPRFVRAASLGSMLRCALGSLCALATGAVPLGEAPSRSLTVRVYLSSSSGGKNDKLNTPVGSPQRDLPQSPFQLPDGRTEPSMVVAATS